MTLRRPGSRRRRIDDGQRTTLARSAGHVAGTLPVAPLPGEEDGLILTVVSTRAAA